MTQSIINNLNNLGEIATNTSQIAKTSGCDTNTAEKSFNTEFKNKLAENSGVKDSLKTRKSSFIGSSNYTTSPKKESILDKFDDILKQESSNANIETALDLTLEKDVTDIIAQLNKLLKNTSDEDSDETTTEENEEEVSIEITDTTQDIITDETSDNTEETVEIPVSTEELTTLAQTAIVVEQDTTIQKEDTNTSTQQDRNIEQSEIVFEDTELAEEAENIVKSETKTETEGENEDFGLDEEALKELKIESVKVETETPDDSSLMQKQSPEEYAVKAMLNRDAGSETFEAKLSTTQNAQQVQKPQTLDINPSKIIEQITKQMESLQNNSKVSIILNPASLGKINIQLINNGNGLNAQLTVNSQEVRDLLMKGLDGLKETMASHGINVDNVQVKVADTQKSTYNQDWTEQEGSRGGNKNRERQNKEEKEKGLFEETLAQKNDNEQNGNV